jgi:hypothetical protein
VTGSHGGKLEGAVDRSYREYSFCLSQYAISPSGWLLSIRPFAHVASVENGLIADAEASILEYNLYRKCEHLAHLLPSSVQRSARSHRLLDNKNKRPNNLFGLFLFFLADV